MGQFYDEIPQRLVEWIKNQHMFWVATAPLAENGHVNLSPKGLAGAFHVVDSRKVWYEDVTGSGVETISHLRENGRITILFCAFDGPPKIVRLFGKGTVHEFGSSEYATFLSPSTRLPGSRSVISIDVHKVGTSCGFGIPFYTFQRHRNQLCVMSDRFESMEVAGDGAGDDDSIPKNRLKQYWENQNTRSIDGLPGLTTAFASSTNFETKRAVYEKDFIGLKTRTTTSTSAIGRPYLVGLGAFVFGIILTALYFQISGGRR